MSLFPEFSDCVDNVEVEVADLDLEEENLKAKRKDRIMRLINTQYLKMTLFSLK